MTIPDLIVNFKSTNPNDFIEVLNTIADKFGAVTNLGVFADIDSVTLTNELKAEMQDEFVRVSIKEYESPELTYIKTQGITSPFELDFETMLGKNQTKEPTEQQNTSGSSMIINSLKKI